MLLKMVSSVIMLFTLTTHTYTNIFIFFSAQEDGVGSGNTAVNKQICFLMRA